MWDKHKKKGANHRMRNVQTQAEKRASVSPYEDYRRKPRCAEWEGMGVTATAVHSHSTSPPSETVQICSSCMTSLCKMEQRLPQLWRYYNWSKETKALCEWMDIWSIVVL